VLGGGRRHHDEIDGRRRDARRRERVEGGRGRHAGHGVVVAGVAARDDPGPRADPLVARLDDGREVVVADHPIRLVVADGDRS
jgi:hypothetical protein